MSNNLQTRWHHATIKKMGEMGMTVGQLAYRIKYTNHDHLKKALNGELDMTLTTRRKIDGAISEFKKSKK